MSSPETTREAVVDATVDLLLGSRCVGCRRPGRLLCRVCAATLSGSAHLAWPTPVPPGLAAPFASTTYRGVPRAMVLGLKERRLLGLVRPLGILLANAVQAALGASALPMASRIVLVPVPSRRASVRARGHDPTYAITARAAALLRREGYAVGPARLLRLRPGVVDQSGLDAAARRANLVGSMSCPTPGLRALQARCSRARVVICDDVLTTGATAREAQRALEAVGLQVVGLAVVAATERRSSAGIGLSDVRLSPPGGTD